LESTRARRQRRLWLSWSSGKDSAWSLQVLRGAREFEVCGLFTTVNRAFERVAMHAVRVELLRAQAAAAGLPLYIVEIPHPCSNREYGAAMRGLIERAEGAGVEAMAFGDLFLADIRAYRERQLERTSIEPVFPLFGSDTPALAREMIAAGLQATVTCVDPKALPASFAGRRFDAEFLRDLPPGVDACGENGEFHSFATAGPMFAEPIAVHGGEITLRDGFVFADLLPPG